MRVEFIRDWTGFYQAGATAEIGPNGITRGQFIELQRRGIAKLIEEAPAEYRTAVEVAPIKRKRGRPRKIAT